MYSEWKLSFNNQQLRCVNAKAKNIYVFENEQGISKCFSPKNYEKILLVLFVLIGENEYLVSKN